MKNRLAIIFLLLILITACNRSESVKKIPDDSSVLSKHADKEEPLDPKIKLINELPDFTILKGGQETTISLPKVFIKKGKLLIEEEENEGAYSIKNKLSENSFVINYGDYNYNFFLYSESLIGLNYKELNSTNNFDEHLLVFTETNGEWKENSSSIIPWNVISQSFDLDNYSLKIIKSEFLYSISDDWQNINVKLNTLKCEKELCLDKEANTFCKELVNLKDKEVKIRWNKIQNKYE